MYFSVFINNNQFLLGITVIELTKINQNKISALICKFRLAPVVTVFFQCCCFFTLEKKNLLTGQNFTPGITVFFSMVLFFLLSRKKIY